MAVNDETGNGTQQQAPQGQQQQQQQQSYNPNQQQGGNHRPGLSNINRLMRRSGNSRASEIRSSEAITSLKEAARAAKEEQILDDSFELFRFDRDEHKVGLPAILVVKSVKVQGVVRAAVRTLILDSEGIRLMPKILDLGVGQRYEIPTLPQDVFNDNYWTQIQGFLRRQLGIGDLIALDAGPLMIPRDLDFKDSQNVLEILNDSVNRCDDVVARLAGEKPFAVNEFKTQEDRLTARIDFSGQTRVDIVGHPKRSDIHVAMNVAPSQNFNRDSHYDFETALNSVTGYMNLEYAPPAPQAMPQAGAWGGQQAQPSQLFTPTFVITDVSTDEGALARTLELYMLALSNAYRVTAGTQWVRAFLPQTGVEGVDMRDIGALGYMTQAGQKIATKSDSFSEQDFVDLMTALVRPQPTFLIDIDPVGNYASIENYFVDAAFESSHQEAARQRLVQAANNLTNGAFSKVFDQKDPIVVPYRQEIHLGWYIDENGDKRDIRDLDVLAMLNYTQGNHNDFFEWYRTYVDLNMHPDLRLQTREKMERQYLSKSLHITGRAIRLLLTPSFIEALDVATREAGVQVSMENITSVMGGQRFAGNSLVNQYMVGRNAEVGYGGPATTQGGYVYHGVTSSGRMY